MKPYKLASLECRPERTRIMVPPAVPGIEPVEIGGNQMVMMAGPCSVEGREMLLDMARLVKDTVGAGAMLRAGAFKPRSSPYSFQGLGVEALQYLVEVRETVGISFITEVMDTRDVELVASVADMIQIGARNMQNFNLLQVVGRTRKPVLIKRGLSNTIEELLMSAEYVMSQGNPNVILCERGIRTFENATRNTLDLSAVPVLQRLTHLPIVVDPAHATGQWDLITPMARAAVAAGADGLMVEVHPDPPRALSDGPQALLPETFQKMVREVRDIADVIGRTL